MSEENVNDLDEPSIPMDQEEEEGEFYSARESQQNDGGQSPITPSSRRSARDGGRGAPSAEPVQQQLFFSDECAKGGAEESKKSQSETKKALKDKNRWDMRNYKKEELEPVAKPKKEKTPKSKRKAKKKVARHETEEKSKTDEESEGDEEAPAPEVGKSQEPIPAPSAEPINSNKSSPKISARNYFTQDQLIMKTSLEKALQPKCKFRSLKFSKTMELCEYNADGDAHQLGKYNERAITNPWRRWGAHNALCQQGGYQVQGKKILKIERGSDPPPQPRDPRQITLNKNADIPNSQSLFGSIVIEKGLAEYEGYRIGKVIEKYVEEGGFVPPPMPKAAQVRGGRPSGGQPQVVVTAVKPKDGVRTSKSRKKASGAKKKKEKESESDSVTDEDGTPTPKAAKKTPQASPQPAPSPAPAPVPAQVAPTPAANPAAAPIDGSVRGGGFAALFKKGRKKVTEKVGKVKDKRKKQASSRQAQ